MGFLYKEVIKNKKASIIKALLLIILFTLVTYIGANSTSYSARYEVELEIILLMDAALAAVMLKMLYDIAYLSRVYYAYKLIDRELIFEKMLGSSRRTVLNIDIKDIEALIGRSEAQKYSDVERTYKFLCHSCKKKIYCCIVNHKGRRIKLYFQPSDELVAKLNKMIKKEPV